MKIGVYGLGRFGSFWAGLLARHHDVKVYSRNRDRPTPEGVERVNQEDLLRLPVLFICTSISSFSEVIRSIAGKLAPGTLLMDTCSVKAYPAEVMRKHVPRSVDLLATHPMFGPDSGRHGVQGLPMILCPIRVPDTRMAEWYDYFRSLGLRIITMSPHEHDYKAAYTQGIAHYVGRVLADLHLQESEIGTIGYQKLLEIMDQTCNDPC